MQAVKTGALIAQARKEQNLTQKDLAQSLHVSVQAVSKWERGLNFPDIALLEPLGELLGLTVSELLSGERNAPAGEETVRTSVQMGKLLSGKARHWRRRFLALALLVVCLGGFFGYRWVRDNTEWLPQKETALIPQEIDESEFLIHKLMGNDIVSVMDTLWADDLSGFTFQLELWEGETMVDCQEILGGMGYTKGIGLRRNTLAYLLKLNQEENTLIYSLYHGGALARSAEYPLPDVEFKGWGYGYLNEAVEVDRETGTILACFSMDSGKGIRAITTGNAAAPSLLEDSMAVVLRMTVQ